MISFIILVFLLSYNILGEEHENSWYRDARI